MMRKIARLVCRMIGHNDVPLTCRINDGDLILTGVDCRRCYRTYSVRQPLNSAAVLANQVDRGVARCGAVLNLNGEHFPCDREGDHDTHGNVASGAIWCGAGRRSWQ